MVEQIIITNPETGQGEPVDVSADDVVAAATMLRGARNLIDSKYWIRGYYWGSTTLEPRTEDDERIFADEYDADMVFEFVPQPNGPTSETDCYCVEGAIQVQNAESSFARKLHSGIVSEIWSEAHGGETVEYTNDGAKSKDEVLHKMDEVIATLECIARTKRRVEERNGVPDIA